jgi:2,4-dienoyl-CoA reductase-like NADH-dependent reductase (Old Yellow Enzyme family)
MSAVLLHDKLLHSPLQIGPMLVAGRVFKAATSETRATVDGFVTDELLAFYVPIADGGTPMIVTGNICVSKQGHSAGRQASLDNDNKISGMRQLVDVVQQRGSKLIAQLNHGGRQTIRHNVAENPVVSASNVTDATLGTTPRPLRRDEIPKVIESFASAAARAREAGFSGVQLHFAHGYLISQFMTPHTNRRNDEYGGSLSNRMRLPLEILRAVRSRVGDDFPVLAKINCTDSLAFRRGASEDDFIQLAVAMQNEGLDAIEISRAHYESLPPMLSGSYKDWVSTQVRDGVGRNFSPMRKRVVFAFGPLINALSEWFAPTGEGYNLPFARRFKQALRIPVITNGGFVSRQAMESAVRSGETDAVSCARAFVADPYLFQHLYQSDPAAPVCQYCNKCVARVGVHPVDCYDANTALLRRRMLSNVKPANRGM